MKIPSLTRIILILFSLCLLVIMSCNRQSKSISNISNIQESPTPPLVGTLLPSEIRNTPQNITTIVTSTSTMIPSPILVTTTPTPQPSLTRQSSTPASAATATAQFRVVTPVPDEPKCDRPDSLQETEVDTTTAPTFCIVWLDEFSDELGFQVHLDYFQSGERFVYEVEANVTQLIVPEMDSPRLNESFEQCLRRKDFMIEVVALRTNSKQRVNSLAVNIECGALGTSSLPTATPTP